MLRALVRELQNVLAEAMKAPSWVGCRQLLYHESCRYLPEAATHGKLLPPSLRKRASVQIGGMLTGRLSAGSDIMSIVGSGDRKALDDVQTLRRSPSIQHRPAPAIVSAPSRQPSQFVPTPASSTSPTNHRAAPVRLQRGGSTQESFSGESAFSPMTIEARRASPFPGTDSSSRGHRSPPKFEDRGAIHAAASAARQATLPERSRRG